MRTIFFLATLLACTVVSFGQDVENLQYKLLSTSRTSTMQKEINEAASLGYRIVVGTQTDRSGMVLFLSKDGTVTDPFRYKLLATSRTSTMQKELNDAAAEGYRLIPSAILSKNQMFVGPEIVVILEKAPKSDRRYEYKLLATTRTSTLEKEVTEARGEGYVIVGMVNRGENMVLMEREKLAGQ